MIGEQSLHMSAKLNISTEVTVKETSILIGDQIKRKFLFSTVSNPQGCVKFPADFFSQTPSWFHWEVSSQDAINVQRLFIHKYPHCLEPGTQSCN